MDATLALAALIVRLSFRSFTASLSSQKIDA